MAVNKSYISILATFFFVLVLLSDFHYKLLSYGYINSMKFTLIIKLVIGVVLGTFVIKTMERRTLLLILCLTLCGCISVLVLKTNTYTLYQYIFGLIIFLFFLNYRPQFKRKQLLRVIKIVIGLNFLCVLLGVFFEVDVFRTYQVSRYGYDGIFKSTSVASFFYMFSALFFIFKRDKNQLDYLWLFIIIILSLLVGSKTLYAFLIFCFIVFSLKYYFEKKNIDNPKAFYFTIILTSIVGLLLFVPLISLNKVLEDVLNKKGVITAFFSYRDVYFINAIEDIQQKYIFSNYLFGGGDKVRKLTELAFVDLFLVFGIVGSFFYSLILAPLFSKSSNISFNAMLVFIVVIIFLRGNFLYFPSVIFISMAIFAIILNEVNVTTKNI